MTRLAWWLACGVVLCLSGGAWCLSDEPADEPATDVAAAADEADDERADDAAAEGEAADDEDETGDEDEPGDDDEADEEVDDDEGEDDDDEQEADEGHAEEAEVQLILSGLNNPTSVAIQPETGHVFVADSGAGRVVAFDPAEKDKEKGKVRAVITGFSKDIYGKGPMYDIGPLGLLFLDQDTLVVGDGSLKDGEELVRIYDLSTGSKLTAEDTKYTLGPIGPGEESAKGEGNFYALAASRSAIYVTCNGDDTKGWVARIALDGGQPGALEPFIATKAVLEEAGNPVDAPVGITLNRDGHIVVGQMGEINVEGDSLYTVYDPEDGSLKAHAATGLYDIAGLAYGPSGNLYAVDYAWMDTTQGGLFRLDIDEEVGTVTSVKLASLDKPTSLAFSPDGALYVTLIGTAEEGSTKKPGKLVRVLGEF
jgi:DNA-binding beta-propeller fold protein YncE